MLKNTTYEYRESKNEKLKDFIRLWTVILKHIHTITTPSSHITYEIYKPYFLRKLSFYKKDYQWD